MPAESNVSGMARVFYIAAGLHCPAGAYGARTRAGRNGRGCSLGGVLLTLGLIGYSPVHALIVQKQQKAS